MAKVEIAANSNGKSTMVPHCVVEVTELHFIIVLIGHFCYWILWQERQRCCKQVHFLPCDAIVQKSFKMFNFGKM